MEAVIPTCRELGIALVPYSPLGRGFLSGKFQTIDDFEDNDFRRFNPRFKEENFSKNLEIVRKVEEIAKSKSVTASQIALAWVISKGSDLFPIPGTKKIKYLKENIEAVSIKLEENEIKDLDKLYTLVNGERY